MDIEAIRRWFEKNTDLTADLRQQMTELIALLEKGKAIGLTLKDTKCHVVLRYCMDRMVLVEKIERPHEVRLIEELNEKSPQELYERLRSFVTFHIQSDVTKIKKASH